MTNKKFSITQPSEIMKCDVHPDSPFLEIIYPKEKDGQRRTCWCLECLYKFLEEQRNGQWNVENIKKKS